MKNTFLAAAMLLLASASHATISQVQVTRVSSSSVSLSWKTDILESSPSVSFSAGTIGTCAFDQSFLGSGVCSYVQTLTVTGLAAGTTYCFRPFGTTCFTGAIDPSPDVVQATTNISDTPTPTQTASPTGTPTFTQSQTFTFSPTVTQSFTFSPTPTPTWTPTASPSWTDSPTPSSTATPSKTPTMKWTSTVTLTLTFTNTPTRTITVTRTPTASPTVTRTDTRTASPTVTRTSTPTPTVTPTATPTPSITLSSTPSAYTNFAVVQESGNSYHITYDYTGTSSFPTNELFLCVTSNPQFDCAFVTFVTFVGGTSFQSATFDISCLNISCQDGRAGFYYQAHNTADSTDSAIFRWTPPPTATVTPTSTITPSATRTSSPTPTNTPVVSTQIFGEAQERFLFSPSGSAQTIAFTTHKGTAGPGALFNAYIIDTVSGAVFSPGTGSISVALSPDAATFASASKATAYRSGNTQISITVPAGLLDGTHAHMAVFTYLTVN